MGLVQINSTTLAVIVLIQPIEPYYVFTLTLWPGL